MNNPNHEVVDLVTPPPSPPVVVNLVTPPPSPGPPDVVDLVTPASSPGYYDDEEYMMDMGGLLSSVLATEDGDTVCSALVNISRQMEVQNKILIKMLSHMQKN